MNCNKEPNTPDNDRVPNQKLNEIAAREEVLLLSLVLKHLDLMDDAARSITVEHFQNEIPRRLYGLALSHHRKYAQLLTRPAIACLDAETADSRQVGGTVSWRIGPEKELP